jgi:signal transduction histidine kinase
MAKLELEFASGLSHELRTPLAVVRSAGYHLVHGNVDAKADVVRYGTMILNEGTRLSEMVEQALLFAQTQSGRSTYKCTAVEVGEMIEDTIVSCREMLPMRSCTIAANIAADLPLAYTDEKAFKHCLRNLLVNAVKYSEECGQIEVETRTIANANRVEIEVSVKNRGQRIAPDDLSHIFEPFFRGRNAAGISGTGLGLYMVKSILKSLGGRITVASTMNETRFALYVPVVDE